MSSENKETRIESWSEIIGRLEALEIDEAQVSLMLSCRGQCLVLSFQKDDPALLTKLSAVKTGDRIGVLRTDTAFHVRTIKNAEDGTH